jgi:hypothetical protein
MRACLVAAFLMPVLVLVTPLGAVPVVENSEQPVGGNRVLQLQEMWRIGGEDDEENLLGVINKVMADDAGNLYLLDIQLTEVQVFSPEGDFLHSLGGPGDGPGELRRASDMVFMPDGTLGLVQGFPGRIVQVDMAGLPAGEWRLGGDDPSAGGFFALQGAACLGGQLVLSGARITRGETTRTAVNFISLFGMDQTELVTFIDKTSVREFRGADFSEKDNYFPHRGGWALAPDGRVYVAPERNGYKIEVYGPRGGVERAFSRSYESWKRTDQELEKARESMIPMRRRNRRAPDVVVEPTEKDILQMQVATDGRLWVLPSRGIKNQPSGIHSTWDLFDDQGNYAQTVSLACDGDGERDAIFFAGNDLVILVKEHAEAMTAFRGQSGEDQESELDARPLEVVCYRITP